MNAISLFVSQFGALVTALDNHIQSHDVSDLLPGGKSYLTQAEAAALPIEAKAANLCKAYKALKPFLAIIALAVPSKWKPHFDAFIGALDLMCP